jgi:hypothetical protein
MRTALWFAAFICGMNALGIGSALVSAEPSSAYAKFSVLFVFTLNFACAMYSALVAFRADR